MTKAIHSSIYKILRSIHELNLYFANKSETIELRAPSITAMHGEAAGVMFFPGKNNSEEEKSLIVVPYDRSKAYMPTQTQITVRNYQKQKITNLVQYGALKEVRLRTLSIKSLGEPIVKENTLVSATVPHIKYPVLIEDYFQRPEEKWTEEYSKKSSKTGEPIYLSDDLARIIVDEGHDQYESFQRYFLWREGKLHARRFT